MDKRYLYKVLRNNTFAGYLPEVASEPSFRWSINTAGSQMQIEVPTLLYTARETVTQLTDETGSPLLSEDNLEIYDERVADVFGNLDIALIRSGNKVEVYEVTSTNPTGLLIFSGYISRYRISPGKESISITVISDGVDLNHYIYGTNTYTLEISATTTGTWYNLRPTLLYFMGIIETFVPASSYSLAKVALSCCASDSDGNIASSVNFTCKLFSGSPGGAFNLLATSNTVNVSNQYPTFQEVEITFPTPIALTSGGDYWLRFDVDNYAAAQVTTSPTSSYASGAAWLWQGKTDYLGPLTQDMYFKVYSSTTIVSNATFTSYDPGQMIRDAVDDYNTQGGLITHSSSVDLTTQSLNYSFITATVLEIIQKAKELAPANWYWYVDLATKIIYFKATLTTATHRFILGKHFSEENLEFEFNIEDLVNVIYFTGGPTAGVNLLKLYTDTTSIANYRRGMKKLTDNRVTVSATAQTLSQSLLDEQSEEIYKGSLEIIGSNYNLNSIKPGDTMQIVGFRNEIDALILQITEIYRTGDSAVLTIGKLPVKSDLFISELKLGLDLQSTLENPSGPA